jgi:hypothetical protein
VIATREQDLALEYWRLGEALSLARRHFAHGQWSKYLATLGIEKTQAARACAIHRTFAGPKQVEGFSVDQAYRERERKQPRRRKKKSRGKHVAPTLASWLRGLCRSADSFLADAAFVSEAESGSLVAAIDDAIEELGRLRTRLEAQLEQNSSVISLPPSAPTTRIDREKTADSSHQ